jgi:glycosyltransferase involved in cell wall biosynthesis
MHSLSIILPAKNEESGLAEILPALRSMYPDAEIIVVNDASSDDTSNICKRHAAHVITHPYSMGNGAAIKTGARAAKGKTLIFMDADGQHNPEDISKLLSKLEEGYDMVVGARHSSSQASLGRSFANRIYNWLASWMVGRKIEDLTSGFRVARATKFREFIYLLPNGFSYPTTISMSFFRAGYPVAYVPIQAKARQGKSHISLLRDGVRFLIIIFKVGTLYSPLKLFAPISLFFFTMGIGYYAYTYLTYTRFTNMSALLLITSILIFLIGLVSEQITTLVYKDSGDQ